MESLLFVDFGKKRKTASNAERQKNWRAKRKKKEDEREVVTKVEAPTTTEAKSCPNTVQYTVKIPWHSHLPIERQFS